jgi:response regulator of citrate/malate metabolism
MIRVLVVDDDYMVAKIHTGFVARTPGFTVVGQAHSGEDALRAARELRPDLVLLDIYLPDMTGLAVLQALRETASDLDVLVITASREAETVQTALRGGVVHYLMKPFTYDDLRRRLDHFLEVHVGMAGVATADQSTVDRVFGARAAEHDALPKGLSQETLQLVAGVLQATPGDLSASDCAASVGISRVSARRYLQHLAATGRADVRLQYGAAGRPERRYAWHGRGAPPGTSSP